MYSNNGIFEPIIKRMDEQSAGAHICPECNAYNDAAHFSKRNGGVLCQVRAGVAAHVHKQLFG